ncbi:enoyl-CoA hydratase family protein [Aquamicrobium sp. LC103]|uniref:enoyl-CoA hydratase family protein n=1 Tax=Aquamicrobium sp. LC103 TaxID=1120658 RepID=UPI00063EC427|nr:enoyl-CoA hydratase family protein [Aquamicrobium sp. LC103]TKT75759.1 enoyl-CoA hydratase family protein [Aquamicrobium sp. LC103]
MSKRQFWSKVEDGIAELVIESPPVNALDSVGWRTLSQEIDALQANPDVRVIVMRAEGRGFCAGVDIKELQAHPERIPEVNAGNWETFRAIHRGLKPVIVAAHGYILGGGIGICGSADIIFCSPDATFGVPEVDRGALGAGAHLQRLFPVQKVRQMYFTGEPIDAAEAHRLGAVERVVPREELRAAAMEVAAKIAAKSAIMIRLAKEALNGIEDGDLEHKYRWEQGFTAQAYLTAESQEARDAFVAKRDADFDNSKSRQD